MGISSKEVYDGLLISAGVVGISLAGQKAVKMGLGVDTSLKGIGKLTVGIILSSMAVEWLQQKNYIPVDPMAEKKIG